MARRDRLELADRLGIGLADLVGVPFDHPAREVLELGPAIEILQEPDLVSLLAGTATIPYVAYHFHRISPYGVVANLVAMPVVSAWVMPMGILGLLAMPFGLDGFCWRLMGYGIEWMTAVALWVTSFPGSLGRMAAFGTGPRDPVSTRRRNHFRWCR